MNDITNLNLSRRLCAAFEIAGIKSVEEILTLPDSKLLAICEQAHKAVPNDEMLELREALELEYMISSYLPNSKMKNAVHTVFETMKAMFGMDIE